MCSGSASGDDICRRVGCKCRFVCFSPSFGTVSPVFDRVGVTLSADAPGQIGEVVVGATRGDEESAAFHLMVCRNCGEPYLEAWETGAGLDPEIGAPQTRRLLRPLPGLATHEEDDNKEDIEADTPQISYLDPRNGKPREPGEAGVVAVENVTLVTDEENDAPHLRRCAVCGHRSTRHLEPITTVHPGDGAFSAVSAQALLEALPRRDVGEQPPMGGEISSFFLITDKMRRFLLLFSNGPPETWQCEEGFCGRSSMAERWISTIW